MPALSVLVVHPALPMPDVDPAARRLVMILQALAAGGHSVTLLAQAALGQESYADELAALGIEVIICDGRRQPGPARPDAAPLDFAALMQRGAFDLAWLSVDQPAAEYLPEIRVHSPGTRIIVDDVAPHRFAGSPVCANADAVVAGSDEDARALQMLAPEMPVAVLAAGVADPALKDLLDAVVPQCFFARDAWSDPRRLRDILSRHLARFGPGDPALLVLPVPADGIAIEQAGELAGRAIAELGADVENMADVLVAATHADPAVPRNAVVVDGDFAPDAASEAETAIEASIVICAYGKRDYSERCLRSLEAALGDRLGVSWEIVLVDNASPDSTSELFEHWSDRATVVSLPENRNFAGGNNAGAAAARGKVLVFLNNDTEVPAGALEAIVDEAARPGVGAVGTRLLYPDGRIQHGGLGWRGRPDGVVPFHYFHYEPDEIPAARSVFEVASVTGACMALPAEVFRSLGGFDERYVNGWEDSDLCMRVRWSGRRVRLRGDVHIVHHEGITSGGDYQRDGNETLFHAQWRHLLRDDRDVVTRTLGAVFNPMSDVGMGPLAADGAPVLVAGPVHSLGPSGDEARGLLDALAAVGVDAASRPATPNWVAPALQDARWHRLLNTHTRALRPGAASIHVGGGAIVTAGGPMILRLTGVAVGAGSRHPTGATAWVPSQAARRELLAQGWPPEAVAVVPPAGIEPLDGAGGAGILVLLPAALADSTPIIQALGSVTDVPLRVLPTVRSGELNRMVAQVVPHADVLAPVTDERVVQRLAAASDVVVALNVDDGFDRQALLAAATGAAVVVRPGHAADDVLGALAHTAEPADPRAIAVAVARAAAGAASDRSPRRAVAAEGCGSTHVAAALETLVRAAGAPA